MAIQLMLTLQARDEGARACCRAVLGSPALGLTGHAGGDAAALHTQFSIIEQDEAVPPHFGRHDTKALNQVAARALAAGASAKRIMSHAHQIHNLAEGWRRR